jgi:histidinol-phosphate aminotransferase
MGIVTPPVHGGVDATELRGLGLDPTDVLDFSASLNPLGPPPGAVKALATVDPSRYPERWSDTLALAIAESEGTPRDRVFVGNGSSELLHLLARAYLRSGDRATVLGPTFGEFEAACQSLGVSPRNVVALEAEGYRWDIGEACLLVEKEQPRLVYLCNPNNPTGVYLEETDVRQLAEAVGNNGLLILDEAYRAFVDDPWESNPLLPLGNVVLLRSMTKDYALAGLRLGCLLGPKDTVEFLRSFQPSWSVNAAAQAAGLAALLDRPHLDRAREAVREAKTYLAKALRERGLEVVPSSANFLLVKVGDGAGIRQALLHQGVAVRDCASFGLPEYVRVGIRKLEDCRRLVEAARWVLGDG